MNDSSDASSGFCSNSIWSVGAFLGKSLGESDSVAHLCPLLQERYRQDCNLAVQLLKCNKSHFRNHKFADVSINPAEGEEGLMGFDCILLSPAFSTGLLASHPSVSEVVGGSCSHSY